MNKKKSAEGHHIIRIMDGPGGRGGVKENENHATIIKQLVHHNSSSSSIGVVAYNIYISDIITSLLKHTCT